MSDTIYKVFKSILIEFCLDDYPMEEFDDMDKVSIIVELETAFNIQIDDNKADELFKEGSIESWVKYIESLLNS